MIQYTTDDSRGTYDLCEAFGKQIRTIGIDRTSVDYSGNVYVAWDTPAGSFMVIASVEFVA